MKFKKFLICIMIAIVSLFVFDIKINAETTAPSSFTVDSIGSISTQTYIGTDFNGGVYVHKKKSSDGNFVYCIQIEKSSGDVTYSKSKELEPKFAYVLQNGYPKKAIFSSQDKDYFTTAIAMWYLSNSDGTTYSDSSKYNSVFSVFNFSEGKYNGTEYDVISKVASLINGAKNYKYVNPKISITNPSSEMILTDDGEYYVSSEIGVTIEGIVGDYSVSLENAPSGSIIIDINGNAKSENKFKVNEKFKIKVPKANVENLTSTFSVKVSATGTINKAYLYVPSSGDYQKVAALYPDNSTITAKTTLGFNVIREFTVSKQDATTGKELPGATLQILDKDKKEIKDEDGNVLYKWVSEDTPHVIINMPDGKYYLKEVIAPEGYDLNENMVEFEIKDGKATEPVIMKNEVTKVDVPDTGKNLIPFVTVGMLLIFTGVGAFIYYKRKNSQSI